MFSIKPALSLVLENQLYWKKESVLIKDGKSDFYCLKEINFKTEFDIWRPNRISWEKHQICHWNEKYDIVIKTEISSYWNRFWLADIMKTNLLKGKLIWVTDFMAKDEVWLIFKLVHENRFDLKTNHKQSSFL